MSPGKEVASVTDGGRRAATKERNREAILSAGVVVFSERGFGEATIRDLIRASGLSTGTFYNYFPDKESVLRALVDRSVTELRGVLASTRSDAHSPEEFISGGFRVFFSYLANDPTFFALLSKNAGAVRQVLDEPILGVVIEELSADLQAAVNRGDLPPFEPELMSAALTGASFELAVAVLDKGLATPEQAADFASRLFLAGVSGFAQA